MKLNIKQGNFHLKTLKTFRLSCLTKLHALNSLKQLQSDDTWGGSCSINRISLLSMQRNQKHPGKLSHKLTDFSECKLGLGKSLVSQNVSMLIRLYSLRPFSPKAEILSGHSSKGCRLFVYFILTFGKLVAVSIKNAKNVIKWEIFGVITAVCGFVEMTQLLIHLKNNGEDPICCSCKSENTLEGDIWYFQNFPKRFFGVLKCVWFPVLVGAFSSFVPTT